MYCPECKSECPDSSNFCPYCGAVFEASLAGAMAKEVGAYHYVALAHMELGRMLLVKKKPDRAVENLLGAKRIFTELENEFYLQQVEEFLGKIESSGAK